MSRRGRISTSFAFLAALAAAPLLGGCAESPAGPPAPSPGGLSPEALPALTWLEDHAVPLRTDAPGGDRGDLEPLRAWIGDARIVALGEATHGTREFFRMKHRILEFLVEELGFEHFAMEAPWGESTDIDAFLDDGTGDPAAHLANLDYWTWNTREILDMLLWMREVNARAGEASAIRFSGFDMQRSDRAMDAVVAYYSRVDADLNWIPAQQYLCWRTWQTAPTYATAPVSVRVECGGGIQAAYTDLLDRRDRFVALSSNEAFERALQAARVVVQHEHYASLLDPHSRFLAREAFMAENVNWILAQAGPDARIVLWAHNAHVRDRDPWLGRRLRDDFGDAMVSVGFAFHRGGFHARPVSEDGSVPPVTAFTAPAAPAGSYEDLFHHREVPYFMADLRPVREASSAGAAWLRGPRPFRLVGTTYIPVLAQDYFSETPLPSDHDLLVYVDETSPSDLLPTPENPRR